MSSEIYVVTDVSEPTGRFLSEELLRNGHKVRVIGRSRELLQPLMNAGADATFGKLDDEEFLTEAFDGAKSVFVTIPRNIFPENARKFIGSITDSVVAAIRNSAVASVVIANNTKTAGESAADMTIAEVEKRIKRLGGTRVLNALPAVQSANGHSSDAFLHDLDPHRVDAESIAVARYSAHLMVDGTQQQLSQFAAATTGNFQSPMAIGAAAGYGVQLSPGWSPTASQGNSIAQPAFPTVSSKAVSMRGLFGMTDPASGIAKESKLDTVGQAALQASKPVKPVNRCHAICR